MTMDKLSKMSMNRILDYINTLEEQRKNRRRIPIEQDRRMYPNNKYKLGQCERGITYDRTNSRFVVYYQELIKDPTTGDRKWHHVYVGSAYSIGDAQFIKSSCRIPEAHTWWNQKPF